MTDRRLALAALDPNAAIAASREALVAPAPRVVVSHSEAPYEDLVLSVEVVQPRPTAWWRFAVFWILMRLAARVYRFKFEVRRTSEEL